jgi:hypothetical protein
MARTNNDGTAPIEPIVIYEPKVVGSRQHDEFNLEAVTGSFVAQPGLEIILTADMLWVAVVPATVDTAAVEELGALFLRQNDWFNVVVILFAL